MKELNYEMVEYSKDIASAISGLDAYELDVFMILTYLARQKIPNSKADIEKDLEVNLSIKELKQIIRRNGSTSNPRIEKAMKNLFDTKYYFRKDKYIVAHHIFEELRLDIDKDDLILKIKKDYIWLFFRLSGNFTQHKILEFNSLKGRYAKRIYQIIMSYKNLKSWEMDATLFRVILEIPKTYGWSDVDKRFSSVVKEFEEKTDIKNFNLVKIKEGKKVVKVRFEWDFENDSKKTDVPEEEIQGIEEVKEQPIAQEKNIETTKGDSLTDYEEEVLEWIFQTYPQYKRPPFKKDHPLYTKVMRGIINNFSEGDIK